MNPRILLTFALCVPVLAQNPSQVPPSSIAPAVAAMTNQDVIDLCSLGLGDDVVIQKISNAKTVAFNTNLDGLKQLKAAKVSDQVIKAMLGQQAAIANASPDAAVSNFHSADGRMRIYVTDHPMNEVTAIIRGSSASSFNANQTSAQGNSVSQVGGVSHGQTGDDPRTVEIQADIQKNCPTFVLVSNNPARADYVLVFRREGGKRSSFFALGGLAGLALSGASKVDGASLFFPNGDMVFATRENTVTKAIKASCDHIPPPPPPA